MAFANMESGYTGANVSKAARLEQEADKLVRSARTRKNAIMKFIEKIDGSLSSDENFPNYEKRVRDYLSTCFNALESYSDARQEYERVGDYRSATKMTRKSANLCARIPKKLVELDTLPHSETVIGFYSSAIYECAKGIELSSMPGAKDKRTEIYLRTKIIDIEKELMFISERHTELGGVIAGSMKNARNYLANALRQ